ncbi:MAG: hypothetical protein AVDCRST_MAG95-1818 [uncultured Adhaeribacter sp.]|uniref:Long-chain fatty acid transport protein n=1 Tax=uncultured Adhaeribacter sp. TaxID=448109 RepID=A0A6J4IEQ1_9BACT|nr:MAG: hypothetical protein AVDCRST_MAG95-1818 [uncultured Adhaeribacter sp.]
MKAKLLSLLGGTLLSGIACAGGFQVNLQGQKQIGMGHAGAGIALDHASIFFNPGALARIRQNGFQVGVSPLISKTAYREPAPGNSTAQTDNPLGTPFQVFGSWAIADSTVRLGLGIYTPFGSSVVWGSDWQGRFGLNELSLQTIFVQPTFSYAISNKVSIGGGPVFAFGSVNLQRSLPLQDVAGNEGRVELDGSARGIGLNAGILVQATDKLSVGLNYRSKVTMNVEEGDATFTVPSAGPIAARFPNTRFDAALPLPANTTLGFGFRPNAKLTVAADIQFVEWSAYESLRFDYQTNINGSNVTESPRNYENVFIYRLGAQYLVSDKLTVRAGGYFDQSPVQNGYLTPETPDSDATGVSAGVSYKISDHFNVDASFLYLNRKQRTDEANLSGGIAGTYKSVGYIPGIGLSYNF